MTPATTAAATAQELREWAVAVQKDGTVTLMVADVMSNAANVIDDLARRVAVLEGRRCHCVTHDGPCDSEIVRSSGLCAYCEEMHRPEGSS